MKKLKEKYDEGTELLVIWESYQGAHFVKIEDDGKIDCGGEKLTVDEYVDEYVTQDCDEAVGVVEVL